MVEKIQTYHRVDTVECNNVRKPSKEGIQAWIDCKILYVVTDVNGDDRAHWDRFSGALDLTIEDEVPISGSRLSSSFGSLAFAHLHFSKRTLCDLSKDKDRDIFYLNCKREE